MSRQQRRALEQDQRKTALRKICLAAGEGVGKALALSFALGSNAVAAEPKKEETFELPPVVVQDQNSPYVVPQSSLSKFPVPLKDTPQSITIVPEKLIEEQAGTTLRDALRNVPGIAVAAGEGGGSQGDSFTLRGFNARNDMFIDGVRDAGSYFRDSFNFESVEVLKGPSSTFFGRGSTGGIINQVSKVPRLDPSWEGMFSGGSALFLRGTIDVNQPLPKDALPNAALRLNLMAQRADVVDRDKIEGNRLGFAPSISFGLGTPTQLTASYLLQHEDNIPDYGFPYADGKPLRIDRDTFYGLNKEDHEETWVNVGTLRFDHRFNDIFNLRNTLRYSHVDRDSAVTNATAVLPNTLNRSRPQRDTQESILGNQTDLIAKFDTFGFGHTATTGVEVSRETFDLIRWNSAGPETTIENPDSHQLPAPKTLAADSDTRATGFGIYAADQIKLNSYFDILGGARWDYFSAHIKDDFANDTRNQIDQMWSYRGGLVFHPTASQSYYFSYGTSFNPSAEGIALTPTTNGTPPEKNRILEAGAKLEFFEGALNFQTALFRIEKTNARTINPDDPTGPNIVTGEQRSQGFEVGLTGRLVPGLNVFGGYTYLDTEILEDNTAANVGNEIANVPQHSATLWTTYDFFDKWQIGGGPIYVGSRFSNNANTNRIPGFVRWDSTIAYQITRNIQLRINAINLTNQFYFDSVAGSKAVPGAGRTFIASASFKF